ncbi:helix-turn-helix transcriptional regulator [Idiomarina sp. ST10R2A5]|uniref:helix-turn-helix transcriptional regulator n=1 Tax=Idiomarina sp. ST10R2A5 TaxID=3418368 RepID=UPI003EC7E163
MLLLDAFFRFSGIGLLLLVSLLAIKDLPRSPSFYFLLLTNLCMVSFFLGFTPVEFQLPLLLRSVLRILDAFLLFFTWLFVLSLFQKDFRLTLTHWLIGILVCAPMVTERLVHFGWIHNLPGWWAELVNSLALLLLVHMAVVALTGRNDDLLEKRRSSRLSLVAIITVSALLTILLGSIWLPQHQPTVNVISLWPPIAAISFWLLKIETQAFAFNHQKQRASKQLDARDLVLQQQLNKEVVEDQAYLENSLSVDELASRVGVAAHRLRVFINQKLGYTNFSTYINSFRIEAVKAAFETPTNDHLPILTIALNHGFSSLPPFNRAFKKQLGITPSEFRKNIRRKAP